MSASKNSNSSGEIFFPGTGIQVRGAATLLAIDDVSLPLKERLCYYLSKPVVRREPVLRPSLGNPGAPDNAATHFYGTVLQDQGKFRVWYYACHQGDKPGLDPLTENVVVPGMAAGRVRPRAPRPKLSCSAPGMSGS